MIKVKRKGDFNRTKRYLGKSLVAYDKAQLEKIAEKQMPNKNILLNTDDDIDDFIEELKKIIKNIKMPQILIKKCYLKIF